MRDAPSKAIVDVSIVKSTNNIYNEDWAEAQWDVSGLFANDRELVYFHDYFFKNYHYKPFSLVHGAPLITWNSGRVLPHLLRTRDEIEMCIKSWVERQVAMDLTFSNPYLLEKHLEDEQGNSLLEVAQRINPTRRNGVIMSSNLLYDYVKKKYPSLKTISSILKVTMERGNGKVDYYKRLAESYDKVMIHPNDNVNFDLLAQLEDKSKYEILINENCSRQCVLRRTHYDSLSKTALDFLGYSDNFEELRSKNTCADVNILLGNSAQCTTQLSRDELKTLYDMGFRKFKVQGRGLDNSGGQILDLLRFTLRRDDGSPVSTNVIVVKFLESMRNILR